MNKASETLSNYLFQKIYSTIEITKNVTISTKELPIPFTISNKEETEIPVSLLGGIKKLSTFPSILQEFFVLYLLWLNLSQGDIGEANILRQKKQKKIFDSLMKCNSADIMKIASIKEFTATSTEKEFYTHLYVLIENRAYEVLNMLLLPKEYNIIKLITCTSYHKWDKKNNTLLWNDFFYTIVDWEVIWMLDILLLHGIDLHSPFTHETLVLPTFELRKEHFFNALLDRGLDIYHTRYKSIVLSQVHWLSGDNSAVLEFMADKGVDINVPYPHGHNWGMTALQLALCVPQVNMAKVLLANGADVNCLDGDGHNAPYHLVADIWSTPSESKEMLELMELVLSKKPLLNIVGKDGKSVISQCAIHLFENHLNLLIDHGADIDMRAKNGMTPLIFLAKKGEAEAVDFLLTHGANFHAVDSTGFSALHHTIISGVSPKGFKEANAAIIQALIDKGINQNLGTAKDKKVKKRLLPAGSTALDLAKLLELSTVTEMLS